MEIKDIENYLKRFKSPDTKRNAIGGGVLDLAIVRVYTLGILF